MLPATLRSFALSCVLPVALAPSLVAAQAGGSVTSPIGARTTQSVPAPDSIGPPAPLPLLVPRSGPLPTRLTLEQAIEEASMRSPAIISAQAEVDARRALVDQAGYRLNPELSVDVENFAGTGPYSGINGVETTVSVSQRLDLGGRRSSRVGAARAALGAQELRLRIARAELDQSVRLQFATAAATRDRLALAVSNKARAGELARVANELVAAGREPPLRAFRARANAAQAEAALRGAEAADIAARRSLASLFGLSEAVGEVTGPLEAVASNDVETLSTLDVRLADAERIQAEAELRQQRAAGRLDPSVGVGVRRLEETNDTALVAGISLPLPIFDRNRGNVDAALAQIRAAEARRAAAFALADTRFTNARSNLEAARARVAALADVAVPQAAEAVRLTELSYRAGRSSLLELLDAQEAFAAAQNELIDARLALAEATATLTRAAAR